MMNGHYRSGLVHVGATDEGRLVNRFWTARKEANVAVLEGFHALKHALRFGAEVERVVTADLSLLNTLCANLAPDVAERITAAAVPVTADLFARLAPRPPETRVIAVARRPSIPAERLLQSVRTSPLILLERPSHLGNVGAVIRVAAAAGAAGVITSGIHDPWGPDAIRGAAGLQYAVPVARSQSSDDWLGPRHGKLFAIHPEGDMLSSTRLPDDAIIVFGSERSGLSDAVLERADERIAIPMQPGVSSLNLATSAAIVLYSRLLNQQ